MEETVTGRLERVSGSGLIRDPDPARLSVRRLTRPSKSIKRTVHEQTLGIGTDLTETVSAEDGRDIRETLSGNGDAYERLIRRYQNSVTSRMWRFTRNPVVLEELVQDVFVEAYFSLKSFKGRAPFLHWIRRLATRVGYRYWKTESRNRRHRQSLTEYLTEPVQPEALQPFEAARTVHRVLAALPPADRLVLTLYYFDECDTTEIADQTGWSRTLVKVRLHRSRKKLKALLEESELTGETK
jgi:RNA polymerase sigma-70 factor, ECF subfamily